MYIPSTELSVISSSEQYGVWAEMYDHGKRVALIAKMQSSAIKAIRNGCKIEVIIGRVASSNPKLCVALRVFDLSEALLIPTAPRTHREILGIIGITKGFKFKLSIYNEINAVCFESECSISTSSRSFGWEELSGGEVKPTSSIDEMNKVLDSFCYEISPHYGTTKWFESECVVCDVSMSNIKEIPFLLEMASNELCYQGINSQDQGGDQELQIAHFLQNTFIRNIYHSPNVTTGKKTRELTDILAYTEQRNFLIESKSIAVGPVLREISQERRISALIKHAKKALGQLEGSIKAVKRKDSLTDLYGRDIKPFTTDYNHGIAVISEFIPSDKWLEVIELIEKLAEENNAYFHVISYPELIKTLKIAGSPDIDFEQCLIQRFEAMRENRTLYIEGTDSSLPFL
ncbi:hypothetical protein R1T43_19215 [Alteromonas sp. CI.11.F.A3]|uniref:hypothetical protein n=1 Tax=Alteromonas sp. CI.11.F.A3 TaxID=3079555 RepID=UPI0029438212|nr:hypothetical protein [Alteromonas sp. CI.11.F.A3]WOI37293.1 hypothetical protein R1T43_19215 [Alteromonas sp. CI.11.F.A3]